MKIKYVLNNHQILSHNVVPYNIMYSFKTHFKYNSHSLLLFILTFHTLFGIQFKVLFCINRSR